MFGEQDGAISHFVKKNLRILIKIKIRVKVSTAREIEFFYGIQYGRGCACPTVFGFRSSGLDGKQFIIFKIR
jgi:hypothetical protein